MALIHQGGWTELVIDGKSYDLSNATIGVDFARAEPDESHAGIYGKIGGRYSCAATFEIKRGDWERFIAIFEPTKPRWGQPGRKRRRKMRLAARRKNAEMQRQRSMAWPSREMSRRAVDVARQVIARQIELEAQAVMDMYGTPIRDPFRG